MALVVTPSSPSATSYVTRAAAVARAAIDPRGTTYLTLDPDVQDALLAMATLDIDAALLGSQRLASTSAESTQSLVLPFVGETVIRQPAVIATTLLAFHYADRRSLGEIGTPVVDTSSIKEETVGPITTVFFDRSVTATASLTTLDSLPIHVRGYLEPFLRPTRGSAWGQGIARRAS